MDTVPACRFPPSARKTTVLAFLCGAFLLFAGVAHAKPFWTDRASADDVYQARVTAAGYVAKVAHVNEIALSYVEGPDNGPPLVLLHAQLLDWFSYSRVLPDLAKSFHVFDIDYPGHGGTVTPANYPMTANQIGKDLGAFITQQIGQPAFVTGNSSGGLLAAWLAANRPDLVRAAVLEDPPLFSSEFPRIKQTIADRAFRTSYTAATNDHPSDFLLYWIRGNATFFRKNVGPGTPFLLTRAVKAYRRDHPGAPIDIALIKNDTVRLLLRGLDRYDPRFGASFYDGGWNQGFDHADALHRITCPVLLLQANTLTLPDGTLNGAMSPQDAQRAVALLRNGRYQKIDAGHVIHLEQPDVFVKILEKFFLGGPPSGSTVGSAPA
ncbi:alpha/beta fold hydrolase [Chitinasiproducens palmae]|uniref:Pimeloyl-ACP methyl ester carboxylesterase n=1 Tax=Chitinasiproducens palmae TaxID=1770053 RepID=A0A1H2PMN0_9BURK|nr:alpha/beta hydrolase [Chitinasiproducens palmae]SDV47328.1 Pimeloyl-ACP methyl ester carboxylesterase [Chitinasiproducens palmae]